MAPVLILLKWEIRKFRFRIEHLLIKGHRGSDRIEPWAQISVAPNITTACTNVFLHITICSKKTYYMVLKLQLTACKGLNSSGTLLFDCPSRHRLRDGCNWQLTQLIMQYERSPEKSQSFLYFSNITEVWKNMVSESVEIADQGFCFALPNL